MATEFHNEVREMLDAAVQQRTADRTAFLRTVTHGDDALLNEALSLLPHYVSVSDEAATANEARVMRLTAIRKLTLALRDDPEWAPPFSIAPYTVVEILGCGGMGVVYRGIDPTRGGEVAIKVLRRRFASSEDRLRFKQEEELLRQLRHPGIVRFLHGGIARVGRQLPDGAMPEPRPFFVMEMVQGATLLEFAKERALRALERAALLVQICRATEHAHARGIIHRDLKPENILVDQVGAPKILDFGIAKLESFEFGGGVSDARFIGTPAYASPEQVAGRNETLAPASDVYTLGLIAHELFTGRLPQRIGGRLAIDLRDVGLMSPGDSASVVDAEFRYALEVILATALRKTRGQRYAHAGELADDLTNVVEVYEAPRGWRAIPQRLANFLRGAQTKSAAPHSRLLAAMLRRRIGVAMERESR